MTVRIGVIGSAGRGTDITGLNKTVFENMHKKLKNIIKNLDIKKENIILVSGGAAWSDHLAIVEYLSGGYKSIELHFPCKFINGLFVDNGSSDWKINPGQSANKYHQMFNHKLRQNSLLDIEELIQQQDNDQVKIYQNYNGFHDRNTAVGNVDILIAFTFSKSKTPTKGGTLDTWKKSKAKRKIHVCISKL